MTTKDIELLLNNASKKCGYEGDLTVSFSNLPKICDFQCNGCFKIAKLHGQNPVQVANNIIDKIDKANKDYEFSVLNGFINIKLTDQKLSQLANEYLQDDMAGIEKRERKQKIVLDYGGANVAKALHIGHLRPAIIGESLKRLYKLFGDEVIADVHLGDWGLQMGLCELQLFEDGKLDYYFQGKGEEPVITLDMLNEAYPKASARKNTDEDFKKKAEDWTVKIQSKQEPYYSIYKKIRAVSVEKIKQHYGELGANFDLWYGESDASEYIPQALKIIKEKGLARESEGAIVVDVAVEGENIPIQSDKDGTKRYKNPMPPCIIEKGNGAVLYATTDIATILMRNMTIKDIDRIEYVTDARQNMHFTQVFRVCKLAGISPENQILLHIGNGTMNGKDGKPFKTRSGDTIKLEDIIDMLVNKASVKLSANGVKSDRDTALMIGVGAMKFGDLVNNVGKDYVFDIDKFLAFEGKTGPYLQYTVVRINSILNKLDGVKGGEIKVDNDEIREIIKAIIKLNSSYSICYREKSLSSLCSASFDLASAFSTFYNNISVANEKDEIRKAGYISLLNLVKNKLMQALGVLAIEVPKKM